MSISTKSTKAEIIADIENRKVKAVAEYNQKVENKCAAMNRMFNYIADVQPRFAALLDQDLKFKKDGTLHAKFLPAFQELYRDVKGLQVYLEWGDTSIWLKVSGSFQAVDCHGFTSGNRIRENVFLGKRDKTGITEIADTEPSRSITPATYHAAIARIKELKEVRDQAISDISALKYMVDE